MKRAITLTGMLLLALTVSCQKADDHNDAKADAKAKIVKAHRRQELMTSIDNARESGDKDRLLAALKTAIVNPDFSPKLIESWAAEIAKIQEDMDFAKIVKLVIDGKSQEAIDALGVFIKKHPENKRAPLIKKGLEMKLALIALKAKAYELYDRGRWAEALPLFEDLKKRERHVRDYWDKIRDCKYRLELIVFNEAVTDDNYDKAVASAEKAREIYPDGYERDIEPKLMAMEAKRRVSATLVTGAEALKKGRYSDVRKILDHLKDNSPEAAEMIRQSRYRENLAKGNIARGAGDNKRALAQYIIARKYAKTPTEREEINALIAAAKEAIGDR